MDYITCSQTKSEYKVGVAICEKCPRMNKCDDFRQYIQPALFSKRAMAQVPGRTGKRKKRQTHDKPVLFPDLKKPEQMGLFS